MKKFFTICLSTGICFYLLMSTAFAETVEICEANVDLKFFTTEEMTPIVEYFKESDFTLTSAVTGEFTCFPLDEPLNKETGEFLKWLKDHFENKSSTSTLKNTAIAKFHEHKSRMSNITDAAEKVILCEAKGLSATDRAFLTDQLIACRELQNKYIERSYQSLLSHVKATAGQKRATIMIEKLGSINSQLRDLNTHIARMFAYFKTFANKLPHKVSAPNISK